MPMTAYLPDFIDLKGIINGIISAALLLVIVYYWSNHRTKSINRRIEAAKARVNQLEYLSRSERAVQLLALRALFQILGVMSIAFSLEAADSVRLTLWRENFVDVYALTRSFGWIAIFFVALYVSDLLGQVIDFPESGEKIHAKIAELMGKTKTKQ
jgi:hypothetical protein